MKIIKIVAILLFTKCVLAQETFPVNGVSNNFEPIYAFTNAHIVLNPTNAIPNGTLLVKGNKIIAVDSNLNIPKAAIIKDLAGDYIYPSFIDLYSDYGLQDVHRGKYNYRPQYDSKKSGAYHWNEAIHPEINASAEWSKDNSDAKPYLENGFGAVLSHAKDGIARGTAAFVALSNKTDNENILIKDAAAFYSFNKGVSKQKYPSSLMGIIALLRQIYFDAEWYELQNSQTNLSFNSFINQQELPQFFAINDELDYNRLYKIAQEFEVDYIIKGNGKEFLRIDEVANTEFPIIIPINFPSSYDVSNPETTEWISLQNLKAWESAPYNPYILAKNGVEFCITTAELQDSKSFLKNLRLAIRKGLNKGDALAALTTTPASLIEINDQVGTLEKGKLANFFIASKDIFENGIIYENWTLGEKHIINKKQEIDIRGYYTFITDKFENKLIAIEGTKAKPKLTLFQLDSIALTTSLNGNNITFSNINGIFRATGKYNNERIIGNYQDSLGNYHSFRMQRDSLFKSKEDQFELVIDNNIPTVWFPNKAHGFADKPRYKNILFKNATVWTNEEIGILQNTDVAISEGKIIAIGTELNPNDYFLEKEFQKIDASNYNLTCGIIDEHSHIAISRGVNEGSQAVTAEVSIGDVINPNDHNIYRQLAGGTVASQLLHGSANPIGGQSAMVKLRWGANAEEMKIAEADGFIKFALGENVKQSNWGSFERIRFPQTRMGVEQVFYDAFYRAKAYQKQWKDYNNLSQKEKRNTSPPREDIELNTLVKVLNSEQFITCHSYIQSEINMLMHVADSMGFTVNTFTHILEGYKVADKMQKHGAGGSTFSDWWAYKFEVNDAIPYNATLLNNAGVITAINSDDAEMGRRLNQEAAKAVKYGGTSEQDAWKMVTLNPAKLLHLDAHMGSIKVGKDADIVLWTDNPLSIYAKVVQTYVDGKLLFDVEVDKKLRARDKAERMRIIKLMSKDKNGGKKRKPQPTKEILYHCDTEHEE